MSICNRLDLQTLGSRLIMFRNLFDHWSSTFIGGKGGARPCSLHTYVWGTNGVCECKVDVNSYMASNGSRVHGHLDYF